MPEHAATYVRTEETLAARLAQDLAWVLDGGPAAEARVLDAVLFDRVVLGRPPDPDGLEGYRSRVAGRSCREFLYAELPGEAAQGVYPHVPCMPRELMWQREDGLRIFFNLRDLAVGLQICQGTFDPEVERVLTRLIRPGAVCVDAGANLGLYTLVMARLGARVHAIEAFPYNHGLLERNVAENGVEERVVTHNVACGAAPGTGVVCFDPTSTNLGEMFVLTGASPVPEGLQAAEIPIARVDDLVPEGESVDLVKIDVEGAELDVLLGMERILGRDRPIVLMELNSRTLRENRGVEPAELMALLTDHGYRAAEVGSMLTDAPVLVGDLPDGCHVFANIVCWHPEAHG